MRRIGPAFLGAVFTSVAAGQTLTLETGETIRVEAEHLSLKHVLTELSEAVPFELVEHGAAQDTVVTIAIEAADWDGVFGKMMRREGYAIVWDAVTGLPRTLIVNWDDIGGDLAHASPEALDANDVEARIRASAEVASNPPDYAGIAVSGVEAARTFTREARQAMFDADDADLEAREAAAQQYANALRYYGNALGKLRSYDEPRTVAVLLRALEESHPEIRLSALRSLRWLSSTGGDPNAIEKTFAAYESADVPAVERAALDVLVRYADPDRVLPIVEQLALTDGPHSSFAAREWVRIRDEQQARADIRLNGDQQLRSAEQ